MGKKPVKGAEVNQIAANLWEGSNKEKPLHLKRGKIFIRAAHKVK